MNEVTEDSKTVRAKAIRTNECDIERDILICLFEITIRKVLRKTGRG